MFSTSLCSTTIHLLPPASRHLNRSRRWSTTLTNGKLTRSSTLNDATGSSIISYNGRVTVTYRLARSLRRISGMRRNWSTIFTESIRGSLDDDWTWRSGIGRFSTGVLLLFSYGFRASKNGVGTGFYHLRRQVKWRWSFPVHRIRREAAHRALIGCGTC
jgi:hypothetical protein